jgi:SAM-dependent methyltransferase
MTDDPLHFYRRESLRGDHTAPWYVSSRLEALFRREGVRGRVLDVGCGVGGNQAALAELGLTAFGIDVSETALKELRATHPGTHAAAADGARLPFADGAFDGAVVTEVLEHVSDPGRVLREVARVVRPGGALFVTSPNYANPAGVRKWWRDRRSGRHDWNPWGAHEGGYEAFMTRGRLRGLVSRWFDVLAEEGLDPGLGMTAGLPVFVRWSETPRGRRTIHRLDRSGRLAPDRLVSRWFGMNTALLARRKAPA